MVDLSNFLDFDACIVIDEDLLFSDCFLAVFPERKIANQDHFGCAKKVPKSAKLSIIVRNILVDVFLVRKSAAVNVLSPSFG